MSDQFNYILAKKEDARYVLNCMKELSVELFGYDNVQREVKYIEYAIEDKDEIYVICEKDGEFVGFAGGATYHIEKNGKGANDNAGLITDILVKEEYRGSEVAYKLFMMIINSLIEYGKESALMVVQDTNPNRYLHYAISDEVISREVYTSENGKTYVDEILLIKDLKKIAKISMFEIGKKAALIKRKSSK